MISGCRSLIHACISDSAANMTGATGQSVSSRSKLNTSGALIAHPRLLKSHHAYSTDRQQELLELVAAPLAILAQSCVRVRRTDHLLGRRRLSPTDRRPVAVPPGASADRRRGEDL